MTTRMRARGPRGTRGMVEMVREQVKALTDAMGGLSQSVEDMRARTATLSAGVDALGKMVLTLAENVDDHEERLQVVEKKVEGRRP